MSLNTCSRKCRRSFGGRVSPRNCIPSTAPPHQQLPFLVISEPTRAQQQNPRNCIPSTAPPRQQPHFLQRGIECKASGTIVQAVPAAVKSSHFQVTLSLLSSHLSLEGVIKQSKLLNEHDDIRLHREVILFCYCNLQLAAFERLAAKCQFIQAEDMGYAMKL